MELIEVEEQGKEIPLETATEIRLTYRQVGGEWKPHSYKVMMTELLFQSLIDSDCAE